jgi:hypothetical protein
MYEVTVNRGRRLITFRATGNLTINEMKQVLDDAKWATDAFRGEPHTVLADMRGLPPLTEDKAMIFGEIIKYGRARGTACCVHLSDSSIARLQQSRLAREASPYDDITVNVVSLDEADKVINEKQASMNKKKP